MPPGAQELRWHAADGHPLRLLDWPAPPPARAGRGSILFLPGRGDVYEKYLEAFEHWRLGGWQVRAADWRGQGGSGRLGVDATTGHIDDFAQYVADLAALWRDWAAGRAGPLVLAAHSMGGHIALRAVIEGAVNPAALVLSAPMLDVQPEAVPIFAKRAYARALAALGDPRRPAWTISEKPGSTLLSRQSLLTHDDDRYADEMFWRAARPELELGPGSRGWLKAAVESTIGLFRPGALESARLPVQIIATSADRLVSPAAIRRAIARLPDAELLLFGREARHEILREADPVRLRALAAIDDFLARRAPA